MTAETEPHLTLREAGDWLTAGRFAALLALLIVASYPGVVLGRSSFVLRDFGLFGYPLAYFHRHSFWSGQWPLWNPLSNCGLPFLAQWNTLILYPGSLIYLLLPLQWSLSFFCLVHQFWGGLGMYVLAHGWTGHRPAAALAGVLFAFNGLALNFLMWPNMVAAYSWLPWVVWLVQRGWQSGGRVLVWAVLAGAMQMLAGGPETILMTWLFLLALAIGDGLGNEGLRKKIVFRFMAMVILVALVCAAQLLPFLQLLSYSQRDSGFGSADWAMPLWGWANLFVPLFRAVPTAQGLFQQPGQYWTSSYYAGVGTLFLAAVALWRVRDWRVRLMAGFSVLGLILALGDRGMLYRVLHACLPGVGLLRYPVKSVLLVLATAPLLAAFGLKALAGGAQGFGRFEKGCSIVIFFLIGTILWLGWRFQTPGQVWSATWQNGLVRAGFLAGILFLLSARLRPATGKQDPSASHSFKRRPFLLSCLILMLFWLDFLTHMPNQNPTVRPSVYEPGWAGAHIKWEGEPPRPGASRLMLAPLAQQALRNLVLPDVQENYLWNRLAFFADCNLLEDVPQIYGFFSLAPREAYQATMLPYLHLNQEFPALLDLLAVSQTTAPGKTSEWVRRPTAMPFVTAGQQPVFAHDQIAFESFFQTNIDFRQTVFLPPESRAEVSAIRQPNARAEVVAFANQRLSIRTVSPTKCLVVLSQTYYPAWRALLDGRSLKIWRGNYAFQAFEVPAGRHQIELRYQDHGLAVGAFLSCIGLALCSAIWWRARGRKRP